MNQVEITCPHCKNPNCDETHTFCFNCGKLLHNSCTDGNCPMTGEELEPNMVYCPVCGSPSLFCQEGYITTQDFS